MSHEKRELIIMNFYLDISAPEISIIEKQYDQASDMWSFGCIMYELTMYLLHQKEDSSVFESKF